MAVNGFAPCHAGPVTDYKVGGLSAGDYAYQVVAVNADGQRSASKNEMRVHLDEASQIHSPIADGAKAEYYLLSGERISYSVRAGIYLKRVVGEVEK